MNHQFDELTKSLSPAITRRSVLKQIGLCLGGLALASLGTIQAHAITNGILDGTAHPNVGGFVWLKSLFPPTPAPLVVGAGPLISSTRCSGWSMPGNCSGGIWDLSLGDLNLVASKSRRQVMNY